MRLRRFLHCLFHLHMPMDCLMVDGTVILACQCGWGLDQVPHLVEPEDDDE